MGLKHHFFPIVKNRGPNGEEDDWYEESLGMVFLQKAIYQKAEGLPEFNNWGGEDNILYQKVAQIAQVERFKLKGLQHQWHPVSCRHENYTGEAHQDFQAYQNARANDHHG